MRLRKKMKGLWGVLSMICMVSSCTSQSSKPPETGQGVLNHSIQSLDSNGAPIAKLTCKVWYRGLHVIEELSELHGEYRNGKQISLEKVPAGYAFINLTSRTVSEYQHFSDTAVVTKTYPLPASIIENGWCFYRETAVATGPLVPLGDTILNGISYKRVKYTSREVDAAKYYTVGYLRCDIKDTLFSLERKYTPGMNCTMTRLYSFKIGEIYPYGTAWNEYLTDTLSSDELKVFDAWTKNTKK